MDEAKLIANIKMLNLIVDALTRSEIVKINAARVKEVDIAKRGMMAGVVGKIETARAQMVSSYYDLFPEELEVPNASADSVSKP